MINDTHTLISSEQLQSDKIINLAIQYLEKRIRKNLISISGLKDTCHFLRLHLANEEREIFGALFLNNQHKMIVFEKIFYGTIDEVTVYPRVVLQKALAHNASAVILVHNHPSCHVEPSQYDINITMSLKKALELVDVRILDHIIVTLQSCYSFKENGIL